MCSTLWSEKHFHLNGLIWFSQCTFKDLLFWSWRLLLTKLWQAATWASRTFSAAAVPWDSPLCRSLVALLRKRQDVGGMGWGWRSSSSVPSVIKPLQMRGQVVVSPWASPSFLPPSCQSSPTHHTPSCHGGWRFLTAQISEENVSLSKDLAFKRRVNHAKLSLSWSLSSLLPPPSVFSPVSYTFPWESPLLSTTLSTFLNLSPIINSRGSCLHSHELFRGETVGRGPARADGDRTFRSLQSPHQRWTR